MTTPLDIRALARVAARAARTRYRWADLRDLEQEAALAMLAALPQYDAARGPLEPFLMHRAWYWLQGWIWRDGVVRQRPDRNAGWARGVLLSSRLAHAGPNPEEALQHARLRRAVERALSRHGAAAQLVATREARLSDIAADAGRERNELAREVQAVRADLRRLAEEHL